MQSKAKTVSQYLAELPEDRRAAISAVRKVILANLDEDFEEGMQYGMIGYYIPHRVYPAGYHCDPRQPVPFGGLASQKNYMSLYLMAAYGKEEDWLRDAWAKSGKKLDMGKCCVRFKRLEDVPLDVVAEAIRRVPARAYLDHYESVIKGIGKRGSSPAVAAGSGSSARTRASGGANAGKRSEAGTTKTPKNPSSERTPRAVGSGANPSRGGRGAARSGRGRPSSP
ncbi:MAG: DUF1801 domain-containing protein [Phycisphaeraceae bacterium]|nr:DUF1801 domain-containing protein [Phycisphaeraceae bacterium]